MQLPQKQCCLIFLFMQKQSPGHVFNQIFKVLFVFLVLIETFSNFSCDGSFFSCCYSETSFVDLFNDGIWKKKKKNLKPRHFNMNQLTPNQLKNLLKLLSCDRRISRFRRTDLRIISQGYASNADTLSPANRIVCICLYLCFQPSDCTTLSL